MNGDKGNSVAICNDGDAMPRRWVGDAKIDLGTLKLMTRTPSDFLYSCKQN